MSANVCRICGKHNDDLKYICDDTLLKKLDMCLNIQINSDDLLPKYICKFCENGVEFSYFLRKQGEETEKRFKTHLEITTENQKTSVEMVEEEQKANTIGVQLNNLIEDFMQGEDENEEAVEYLQEEYLSGYVEDEQNEVVNVEKPLETGTESTAQIGDSEIKTEIEYVCVLTTYICHTCNLVLNTQNEYRKHIKIHGSKRFQCTNCEKWFATKGRYDRHIMCHNGNAKEGFQCPQCERSYRGHGNLLRHIRVAHEMTRNYKCPECFERFGRVDVLKNHMARHEKSTKYECTFCDKGKFKSKRYLNAHLKTHIKNKENQRSNVSSAEKFVSTKKSLKVYHCHICGKISKHNFTHKNHLRIHTQERSFKCNVCEKTFRTSATLVVHKRIHTDERPYVCEICQSAFRQSSHLKEHLLIHNGVLAHKCTVCSLGFVKKNNLLSHLRVHTGEKPFQCTFCSEGFTRQILLKRHLQSEHTNVEDNIKTLQTEKSSIEVEKYPIAIDNNNDISETVLVADNIDDGLCELYGINNLDDDDDVNSDIDLA